jgi:hypothetical protein
VGVALLVRSVAVVERRRRVGRRLGRRRQRTGPAQFELEALLQGADAVLQAVLEHVELLPEADDLLDAGEVDPELLVRRRISRSCSMLRCE